MGPTWLFEADVFGTMADPLKAEIRRQGMGCHITRQDLLARGYGDTFGGRQLDPDGCVITCGCFPFVRSVQTTRRWIPGGWCNPETLACSAYYPHFRRYLLNHDHLIATGVAAVRDRDAIFATFGRDGRVFVRPDGCQKLFTGRVVTAEDFADALTPARYDPTARVVIARPRAITREWRLIVAGGQIVVASQYLADGVIEMSPGCPSAVRAFAGAMLADVVWRPDDIFMADVCESDGDLRLLELNGFSCSAVYPCDYRAVVAVASSLATRAWDSRSAGGTGPDRSPASTPVGGGHRPPGFVACNRE